jgi:hypothetical protein
MSVWSDTSTWYWHGLCVCVCVCVYTTVVTVPPSGCSVFRNVCIKCWKREKEKIRRRSNASGKWH